MAKVSVNKHKKPIAKKSNKDKRRGKQKKKILLKNTTKSEAPQHAHRSSEIQRQIQKHVEQSVSPESKTTVKTILKPKKSKQKVHKEKHVSFDNGTTEAMNGKHKWMKGKENVQMQQKDKMKKITETKASNKSVVKRKSSKLTGQLSKSTKKHNSEQKTSKLSRNAMAKDLRRVRKTRENVEYELSLKAKKIHEELRRHDTKDIRRNKLCLRLLALVKGHLLKLIFAHDTARVIACLMAYGNVNIRNQVFEELKENIVDMSKSKYAKFFVRKLLKVGNKDQREHVFTSFQGEIRKLIKHSEAAYVIEFAYNEVANAEQRSAMLSEFYGAKFAFIKDSEQQQRRSLAEVIKADPSHREVILQSMRECIVPLTHKQVVRHSIVHRALYEYLQQAGDRARTEMAEVVKDVLAHIVHTHDGSRVAMYALWYGTNKVRSLMVKTLTGVVSKLCCEEHGHMVILAAFDCVTNVKMLSKVIIREMVTELSAIISDRHGRKVLLYLMSPRDPHIFHPDVVRILEQGDRGTSSSDRALRMSALVSSCSDSILSYLSEHITDMLQGDVGSESGAADPVGKSGRGASMTVFILTAVTHLTGKDKEKAVRAVYEGICQLLVQPVPLATTSASSSRNIESAALHLLIKKLIAHDKTLTTCTSDDDAGVTLFTDVLLDVVPRDVIQSWVNCNRGCFTLLQLLECGLPSVTGTVRSLITTDPGIRATLTQSRERNVTGARLLLDNIDSVTH